MKRALWATAIAALLVSCGRETPEATPAATPPPAATAAQPAASATPPAAAAETLVAELYKEHDASRSPFFQTEDRARLERYFEKSLAELIWRDAVASQGEVGVLEFDPLYAAQDVEIKNLVVHPAQLEGTTARVRVTFDNYDAKQEITYSLTPAAQEWKITDVHYPDDFTLRSIFAPTP